MPTTFLAMPQGAEWLVILLIVVLVFGAAKLPDLARSSGQALRIFKTETKGMRDGDEDEPDADKTPEQRELEARKAQAEKDTTTVGTGWSTVVVTKLPSDAASSNETLQGFLSQLKPVSGSWGTGRELDGTIVTAILTDDGRLAVGAVGGDVVAAALAR